MTWVLIRILCVKVFFIVAEERDRACSLGNAIAVAMWGCDRA
ncbi:hypothetical protein [Trichocoleus sp. FACHB-69]|nr:hypothetical protein [Trichocoleus sp. FACHB-69]